MDKLETIRCHSNTKRGLVFLVVDDDQTIRKIMRLQLKAFGLRIDVAEDGEEAVKYAKNSRYDVIFMDIQMPRMNGITAATSIRSLEAEQGYAPAHIVATTAGGATRQQCLDAGMNDYLQKPVGFEMVINVLYDLLVDPNEFTETGMPKCGCCA